MGATSAQQKGTWVSGRVTY